MGSRASGITERVGDGVEIGTQGLGRHRSGRGAHTAAATPMPGQAEPCRGGGEMQGPQEAPALHAATLGLGTGQRLQRALAPLARTQRGQHLGRRAFPDSVSLGSEMVFCGINKLGTEWPPQGACLDHGRSPSTPGPPWAVAPEFWVPAGVPVKNSNTGTTCI